jgi:hypothetical protein
MDVDAERARFRDGRLGRDPEPFTGLTHEARFYEALRREGDRIDVSGWVARVDTGEPGDYRGRGREDIGFAASPEAPLVVRRA